MEVLPKVRAMYLAHPFPQWTRAERKRRFALELCRYRFLGLEGAMKGARFLDVGCGTGNRSMLAAKNFGVAEFVGLDGSDASLETAVRVAKEEDFDRFTPVKGNLLEMPFPDNSFDVVVSWGVLHHTDDPLRGFSEMVRVCRPGGYVAIFLYNVFGHWRHNLQKDKVSRLAGEDFEKRFEVAHRLYGKKPESEMSPEEIAVFYDQYCHPHKSDHTFGETLSWFDKFGLEPVGSYPPLGFRDALACAKYRAELLDEFPLRRKKAATVLAAAKHLPVDDSFGGPDRPSLFHRFFWQTFYAFLGRSGSYSHGAAMSARKPPSAA